METPGKWASQEHLRALRDLEDVPSRQPGGRGGGDSWALGPFWLVVGMSQRGWGLAASPSPGACRNQSLRPGWDPADPVHTDPGGDRCRGAGPVSSLWGRLRRLRTTCTSKNLVGTWLLQLVLFPSLLRKAGLTHLTRRSRPRLLGLPHVRDLIRTRGQGDPLEWVGCVLRCERSNPRAARLVTVMHEGGGLGLWGPDSRCPG